MKRISNICLFIAFLFGYLEWGKDHAVFIFQGEAEIFAKAKKDVTSVLHPFILLPFLGQLIILYTVFQPKISRLLSLTGLACLSLLILLLFIIGLITLNFKIAGSTLPFLFAGMLVIRYNRKPSSNY